MKHSLVRLGRLRNHRSQICGLLPGQLPVGFRFDAPIRSFRRRLLDERRDSHPAQRRSVLDLLRQSRWETSVDALRRRSRRAASLTGTWLWLGFHVPRVMLEGRAAQMISRCHPDTDLEIGDTKMRAAVYETAVLGRSGLHLISLMYVSFRQIDPSIDGGIDLWKEHAEAEKLVMIM